MRCLYEDAQGSGRSQGFTVLLSCHLNSGHRKWQLLPQTASFKYEKANVWRKKHDCFFSSAILSRARWNSRWNHTDKCRCWLLLVPIQMYLCNKWEGNRCTHKEVGYDPIKPSQAIWVPWNICLWKSGGQLRWYSNWPALIMQGK